MTYNAAFENEFGFLIERKQSSIENAGQGVFVTSGCIPEHHIAAMYPGIYLIKINLSAREHLRFKDISIGRVPFSIHIFIVE